MAPLRISFPRTPAPWCLARVLSRQLVILLLTVCTLFDAVSAEPEVTPKRGGTLNLWLLTDWRSLDPADEMELEATIVMRLLFRGLLDFDAQGNVILDQATRWDVSPDGRTHTFQLKPGVRFSNGREVEAADYVDTFQQTLDPKVAAAGQSYYTEIRGAADFIAGKTQTVPGLRAPDARTFVIELERPSHVFPMALALGSAAVKPRDLVQQYGKDFIHHLTGTGPYRVATWQRGVRWRLERNPHYNGTDGFVDAFEIQVGGDRALMSMLLQRGEIDRTLTDSVQATALGRMPGMRSWVHSFPMVTTTYVFMNTELKPFDDARVRQAVNHAIDRQRLIRLLGGFATPAIGVIPPTMPWSNPTLPQYVHNPERARQLLREAGFPKGFKTEFIHRLDAPGIPRVAESIQQDLQAVGIQVELRPLALAGFFGRVETRGKTPMGIQSWTQDYPDPSNFLELLLDGTHITDVNCLNVAFYNNATVSRLLHEAAGTRDVAQRLGIYRQAEQRVMQDAPWAPLFHPHYPVLRSLRVHGDAPDPVWGWRYERMWLSE